MALNVNDQISIQSYHRVLTGTITADNGDGTYTAELSRGISGGTFLTPDGTRTRYVTVDGEGNLIKWSA